MVSLNVGKDIDFNIVVTVFGKGREKIVDWINKGYATYIDKEKALNYLHHSAPIAEALSNPRLISTTKVIQNFENPKIEPRYSLRSDVADILNDYDNDGVKYGSILDVADGIEAVIADTAEEFVRLMTEVGMKNPERERGNQEVYIDLMKILYISMLRISKQMVCIVLSFMSGRMLSPSAI